MQTFSTEPRHWFVTRIVGRNPLIRRTDRIEALTILLALVASLFAVPVSGIVGATIYTARHERHDQEVRTHHLVTATIINVVAASDKDANHVVVQAHWTVDGDHRASFDVRPPASDVSHMDIWVDAEGNLTNPPTPAWHALADAVGVAIATAMMIGLTVAWLRIEVQSRLDRLRHAQWDRDIRSLQRNDGRANWH